MRCWDGFSDREVRGTEGHEVFRREGKGRGDLHQTKGDLEHVVLQHPVGEVLEEGARALVGVFARVQEGFAGFVEAAVGGRHGGTG